MGVTLPVVAVAVALDEEVILLLFWKIIHNPNYRGFTLFNKHII
jgi:hypothetical protein